MNTADKLDFQYGKASFGTFEKTFPEIPVERQILQLAKRDDLEIPRLFGKFSEYISSANEEGLGPTNAILLRLRKSGRWFCFRDTLPSSGIMIEAQASHMQEIPMAFDEIVNFLEIDESEDIQWVSPYANRNSIEYEANKHIAFHFD